MHEIYRHSKINSYDETDKDLIHIFNVGISNFQGLSQLTIHPWHSGLSNLAKRGNTENLVNVVVKDYSIFDSIDNETALSDLVVKIDTEGHELIVLNELRKSSLSKKIRSLILEISPQWLSQKDRFSIFNVLLELGFNSNSLNEVLTSKKQFDLIIERRV